MFCQQFTSSDIISTSRTTKNCHFGRNTHKFNHIYIMVKHCAKLKVSLRLTN